MRELFLERWNYRRTRCLCFGGKLKQPAKHHHFSFDELGFLVKLHERLSADGIVLGLSSAT